MVWFFFFFFLWNCWHLALFLSPTGRLILILLICTGSLYTMKIRKASHCVCYKCLFQFCPLSFIHYLRKYFFIEISVMKIAFACSEEFTQHREIRAEHKGLSPYLHVLSSKWPLQVREDGPYLESEAKAGEWKLGTRLGHPLPLASTLETTRQRNWIKQPWVPCSCPICSTMLKPRADAAKSLHLP